MFLVLRFPVERYFVKRKARESVLSLVPRIKALACPQKHQRAIQKPTPNMT